MPRRTVLLAALAVLVGAGQALAQKPTKKESQQERVRGYYQGPLPRTIERTAPTALVVVPESEPNDAFGQADAVNLADQGTGEVNPAGDVDYWVFNVTAGTVLDIDVDASEVGSPLDPTLELFDVDGVTSLAFMTTSIFWTAESSSPSA